MNNKAIEVQCNYDGGPVIVVKEIYHKNNIIILKCENGMFFYSTPYKVSRPEYYNLFDALDNARRNVQISVLNFAEPKSKRKDEVRELQPKPKKRRIKKRNVSNDYGFGDWRKWQK